MLFAAGDVCEGWVCTTTNGNDQGKNCRADGMIDVKFFELRSSIIYGIDELVDIPRWYFPLSCKINMERRRYENMHKQMDIEQPREKSKQHHVNIASSLPLSPWQKSGERPRHRSRFPSLRRSCKSQSFARSSGKASHRAQC